MQLSYIIVTRNRCRPLLRTLEVLHRTTPLPDDQWEVWVVDNGSTDGTAATVREKFPKVKVLGRPRNEGVAARSYAFEPAKGEYLVLLDDDSYPEGRAVTDSMDYLRRTPHCGAVVGRCLLPDDTPEAPDLPAVMQSGAVCLRKKVVERVGVFRPEFFLRGWAEDLSFRIWKAGWAIERFEDIIYRHERLTTARDPALAHYMAMRNHLILIERYLPKHMRPIYRKDWKQRYRALGAQVCHDAAVSRGRRAGFLHGLGEMWRGREVLSEATNEILFQWRRQARQISAWAEEHDVRKVIIADYAKNLYATFRGCRLARLDIAGIVDDTLAFRGLKYRGLKVRPLEFIKTAEPDGIVLANINPAEVGGRDEALREYFDGPILHLWSPRKLHTGLASLTAGEGRAAS